MQFVDFNVNFGRRFVGTLFFLTFLRISDNISFLLGIDIPKCNFVMRYDFPKTYQSYVQCKSRARAVDALHILLISQETMKECARQLAQYHYIEKVSIYDI